MQNEATNVIKVKFLRNGEPSGMAYAYYTPEPVAPGDTVEVEAGKYGIAVETNVPYAEIEKFADRAKTVIGKAKEAEAGTKETEAGKNEE